MVHIYTVVALMRTLGILLLLACSNSRSWAASQEHLDTRVGAFLFVVSNLDQSVEFYRQKVGLQLKGSVGTRQTVPVVAEMWGSPGKWYRAAHVEFPGSDITLELVEWQDAKRDPRQPTDQVRLRIRGDRTATFNDPDGFAVELIKDVTPGVELELPAASSRSAVSFYKKVFGRSPVVRRAVAPHGVASIVFANSQEAITLSPPFLKIGRAMIRLFVTDVDSTLAELGRQKVELLSAKGAALLPNGARAAIFRGPAGIYMQAMQLPLAH